jgi:uncharacterized protein
MLTKTQILKILKEYKLRSRYKDQIKEIGLFGSYAGSSEKKRSDVDIFVRLDQPRMFDMIGIKFDLEKILKKKVDIIALRSRMNKFLRKEIENHGIRIQ